MLEGLRLIVQKAKLDCFAFIRQYGFPSWFLTLTANEIGWADFHAVFNKRNGNQFFSKEEFDKMDREGKLDNLKKDPVFAVEHFHRRLESFINYVIKSKF